MEHCIDKLVADCPNTGAASSTTVYVAVWVVALPHWSVTVNKYVYTAAFGQVEVVFTKAYVAV